jgi:hypothetical protein
MEFREVFNVGERHELSKKLKCLPSCHFYSQGYLSGPIELSALGFEIQLLSNQFAKFEQSPEIEKIKSISYFYSKEGVLAINNQVPEKNTDLEKVFLRGMAEGDLCLYTGHLEELFYELQDTPVPENAKGFARCFIGIFTENFALRHDKFMMEGLTAFTLKEEYKSERGEWLKEVFPIYFKALADKDYLKLQAQIKLFKNLCGLYAGIKAGYDPIEIGNTINESK